MRLSPVALALPALLLLAPEAHAQDPHGATDKKDGVAPVASPAPAMPLPEPPEALAKLLAAFDKDPEPQREAKRVFASALYYLLDRNLERYLLCFHPDYELEESGSITKLPLADHKARVIALWEKVPKSPLGLGDLVLVDKARAYTRAQAKAWIGDWKKRPSDIAPVMEEGDELVIAPINAAALGHKPTDFEAEVYYVLRKQDGIWKVVLGE